MKPTLEGYRGYSTEYSRNKYWICIGDILYVQLQTDRSISEYPTNKARCHSNCPPPMLHDSIYSYSPTDMVHWHFAGLPSKSQGDKQTSTMLSKDDLINSVRSASSWIGLAVMSSVSCMSVSRYSLSAQVLFHCIAWRIFSARYSVI